MTNELVRGGPYELDAKDIIATDEDITFGKTTRSVHALDDVEITLPTDHAVGQRHYLVASGGSITLVSGDATPILNGTFIPAGSRATVEFAYLTSLSTFAWVVSAAGGGFGTGEILVGKIADVVALDDTSLPDGVYARPRYYIDQPFELDKSSTADPDGITILPTKSNVNGNNAPTGPGRWLRREVFVKRHSLQLTWWIDPVNGDDENDGAADAAGRRLKTTSEACRRLHQAETGRNYQINVIADVPVQESSPRPFGTFTALVKPRFRPSITQEMNAEDVIASTGNEQTNNVTMNGRRTVLQSGTFTDYTVSSTTAGEPGDGNQATISGASIALSPGDMLVITSAGSNLGAISFVGKALGGNKYRVLDFIRPDNSAASAIVATATTFDVVKLTSWGPSFLQVTTMGRFQINDFEFPAPLAAPADQLNVSWRVASVTLRSCKFRRGIQPSFGCGATIQASAFLFPGDGLGPGVGGKYIENQIGGTCTYSFVMMLNTDWRLLGGMYFCQIASVYLQDSLFQTRTTTAVPDYGFTLGAAASTGVDRLAVAGNGIGVYDWPSAGLNTGILLSDDAVMRLGPGTNLRGKSAAAGAIGVFMRNKSHLLVSSGITPTITGTVEVLINNPLGASTLAVRAGQQAANPIVDPVTAAQIAFGGMSISTAGPVVWDAQPLNTWANWIGAGAGQFRGYAFNPHDGSSVRQISNL